MTLSFPLLLSVFSFRIDVSQPHRALRLAIITAAIGGALTCSAQSKSTPETSTDVVVLSNGDTLHGKFVSAIGGKVTFHSDPLGDIALTWDKIKELHTGQKVAVLQDSVKVHGKKIQGQIPIGTVDVADQIVSVHPESAAAPEPIPLKSAQYIVDQTTLDKQIYHEPSLKQGWNGAATAGATLVTATQNQYTFSGAVALVRVVPTVSWLDPRNRTSVGFTGSYGKITQPAYVVAGVTVPEVTTKSAIYHADAERDQYFSPRFFALVQTAFDHNFGQDLDLQQIYGGGIGWTALKTPKQEVDLKATMQYEKQQFISGPSSSNQNLIGSTFAARLHPSSEVHDIHSRPGFYPRLQQLSRLFGQ